MKIDIILDFICPYCFVGEKILEKALQKHNLKADFKFLPYELCPEPNPQLSVNDAGKKYFLNNIANWAKEEGILIHFPTINPKPRTNLAFEGLYIAEKYDKGIDYIRAVLDHYWVLNKDIGDISILVQIADSISIPSEEFKNALLSREFKEKHKTLNLQIADYDFDVVPTFYINGEQLQNFPRNLKEWEEILN
ncbi:MAG: DsbA family oxidoreductase [Cetobacterium sp.]